MEARYLIFVYEPYEKYHKVIGQPYFAMDAEMAYNFIMQIRNRSALFFIDILRVSDSLDISKIDNKIPVSTLRGLFKEFEKEKK